MALALYCPKPTRHKINRNPVVELIDAETGEVLALPLSVELKVAERVTFDVTSLDDEPIEPRRTPMSAVVEFALVPGPHQIAILA